MNSDAHIDRPDRRSLLKMTAVAGVAAATSAAAIPGRADSHEDNDSGNDTITAVEVTRVRRSVDSLGEADEFFEQYAQAVRLMHELPDDDPRSWRSQAKVHVDFCPHGAVDFLHWHRYYIGYYERIIGSLLSDNSFALPYWDWTANNGRLPAPFFDNEFLDVRQLKDVSNIESDRWGSIQTEGTRQLSKQVGLQDDPLRGGVFSSSAIEGIMRQIDFDVFMQRIEGSPHNVGHVLTGAPNGHMINGMSPLDPVFWLHHCNVDRLWAQWQSAGNLTPDLDIEYDAQFVDESASAVRVNALDVNVVEQLGYTYDSIVQDQLRVTELGLDASQPTAFEARALQTSDRVLGSQSNATTSIASTVTSIRVSTDGLRDALASRTREFRPTVLFESAQLGVEKARVLAKLKDVHFEGAVERLIVNVFVNCPYLTEFTSWQDEGVDRKGGGHYADSFAFFMRAGHHKREFLVDLTAPLQSQLENGRVNVDEIDVQLVPVTGAGHSEQEKPVFTVGEVEILMS